MRVTCTNCGGAHTPWDCKRPAKKSTERKNKPVANGDAPDVSLGLEDRASSANQAVDTSRVRKKALAGEVPNVNEQPETEGKLVQVQQSHSASIPKRPRGRPKTITDMKAYKAAKQREYRAKWKGRE